MLGTDRGKRYRTSNRPLRPRGTSRELEGRRRRAIGLLQKGQTYRAVAQLSGASLSSVVRWLQAFRHRGVKGLNSRPTPGRPCRLSAAQKKALAKTLLRGAQAAGYSTELWTLRRIGEVIKRQFGVRYCSSGVWRLLVVDMKWSTQKPERWATERDEAAIEQWKRGEWSRIKKNASAGRLPGFRRRKWLSAQPDRRADVGPQGQDAAAASQLSQGPHLHYFGADDLSATRSVGPVRALPPQEHHRRPGHRVSPRSEAAPARPDRAGLGWRFDPLPQACAGLCPRVLRSVARASFPWLRSGVESNRVRMDKREASAVQRNARRHRSARNTGSESDRPYCPIATAAAGVPAEVTSLFLTRCIHSFMQDQ